MKKNDTYEKFLQTLTEAQRDMLDAHEEQMKRRVKARTTMLLLREQGRRQSFAKVKSCILLREFRLLLQQVRKLLRYAHGRLKTGWKNTLFPALSEPTNQAKFLPAFSFAEER